LWPLDGISGTVLAWAFGEDTVYAPGYTDDGFRRVEIGMTRAEVLSLIGPPLARWPLGSADLLVEYAEKWSTSPGDTNFRRRVIWFREGRVARKFAEYWVD
jgi:hypothetical protein